MFDFYKVTIFFIVFKELLITFNLFVHHFTLLDKKIIRYEYLVFNFIKYILLINIFRVMLFLNMLRFCRVSNYKLGIFLMK